MVTKYINVYGDNKGPPSLILNEFYYTFLKIFRVKIRCVFFYISTLLLTDVTQESPIIDININEEKYLTI